MSKITVSGFSTAAGSRWSGSTAYLQIYYAGSSPEAFSFSTGEVWKPSLTDFYREIECDLAGNVVDVDTFVLDSTPDITDRSDVFCYLRLVDAKRNKNTAILLGERWDIPISLGSTVTYEDLRVHNTPKVRRLDDRWSLSRTQIEELIEGRINVGNPATPTVLGRVKLSRAYSNPASPVVVTDEEFDDLADDLAAHIVGTTNVHGIADTSKLVVTSDARLNKVENYADFATALSTISSTPTTLYVTSAVTAQTATVPETITLKFIRGGSLNIATGQTLTILGAIEAPPHTIFTNILSGQGVLSFEGNKKVREVLGAWFGMKADSGTTDNSPYLQAAIDCLDRSKARMRIQLDRTWEGWYSFSSGIQMVDMEQICIEGSPGIGLISDTQTGVISRSAGTELRYTASGSSPFINGNCLVGSEFRNLIMRYTSPGFVGDFISFAADDSVGSGASVANIIDRCFIGGFGGNEAAMNDNAVNARMLLNLRNTVEIRILSSTFSHARRGIGGRVVPPSGVVGTPSTAYSNSVVIDGCRLQFLNENTSPPSGTGDTAGEGGYAVVCPGTQWDIRSCVFEPNEGPAFTNAIVRGITTEDPVVRAGINLPAAAVRVSNCGFWDSQGGGIACKIRGQGWLFEGNLIYIYNNGTTKLGQFLKVYGDATTETRGLVVIGNRFTGTVSVSDKSLIHLDITAAQAGKVTGIVWAGNSGDSEIAPPPPDIPWGATALTGLHYFSTEKTISGSPPHDIKTDEGLIRANAAGGAFTCRLPAAPVPGFTEFIKGRTVAFIKTDSSTNAVTITGAAGTETIGGAETSYRLTRQGQAVCFFNTDGTNWMVLWEGGRAALTGDDAVFMVPRVPTGGVGETTEAVSDSNNAVRAYRFKVTEPTRITKISFRIGTAGNVLAVGIYDSAGNKLVSADNISISAGTTTYTGTVTAITLLPDTSYFIAFAADTTVPTIGGTGSVAAGFLDLLNKPTTGKSWVSCANAMSGGVLPATLGALTGITSADSIPFWLLHN
ncbi:MAG TPA: hypothetical protein VN256_13265 [Pyrinomonadaceae bacterium]|nr:hypothetical protein [Pyrinomonadaceae bacterium]